MNLQRAKKESKTLKRKTFCWFSGRKYQFLCFYCYHFTPNTSHVHESKQKTHSTRVSSAKRKQKHPGNCYTICLQWIFCFHHFNPLFCRTKFQHNKHFAPYFTMSSFSIGILAPYDSHNLSNCFIEYERSMKKLAYKTAIIQCVR